MMRRWVILSRHRFSFSDRLGDASISASDSPIKSGQTLAQIQPSGVWQSSPNLLSPLKILRSSQAARRVSRAASGPIILVPTMGALHRGHTALIDRARRLAGPKGLVAVSIFVNPAQFGPGEDLSRYPRPFSDDRRLCQEHGVDLLFHPSAEEMYPPDFSTFVEESRVSERLCGAARPGHFRGVCTIVLKLFQIFQPTAAVFGQKDFQQCAVLKRMVRDLDVPVKIVIAPTVREPDGLALSSRNRFLSPAERAEAVVLRRALLAGREAYLAGEKRAQKIRALLEKMLRSATLARIDYLEIVSAKTLQPVETMTSESVLAVAVFFGKTRLIDNLPLS